MGTGVRLWGKGQTSQLLFHDWVSVCPAVKWKGGKRGCRGRKREVEKRKVGVRREKEGLVTTGLEPVSQLRVTGLCGHMRTFAGKLREG